MTEQSNIPAKTIERRGRQQLKRMKAALSGGWSWTTPRYFPSVEERLLQASDRAERRRAKLGRS